MFISGTREELKVKDKEIIDLLWEVYVDGGYTSLERGEKIFKHESIFSRGKFFCIRSKLSGELAAMIILVLRDSKFRVFAAENEAEIHLLGVKMNFRNSGLGKSLLNMAVKAATDSGYKKILLWTQPSMLAAQRLYEKSGFCRAPLRDFEQSGKTFLFYEKNL